MGAAAKYQQCDRSWLYSAGALGSAAGDTGEHLRLVEGERTWATGTPVEHQYGRIRHEIESDWFAKSELWEVNDTQNPPYYPCTEGSQRGSKLALALIEAPSPGKKPTFGQVTMLGLIQNRLGQIRVFQRLLIRTCSKDHPEYNL